MSRRRQSWNRWIRLVVCFILGLSVVTTGFLGWSRSTQAKESPTQTPIQASLLKAVSPDLEQAHQLNAQGRQQLANGQASQALETWRAAEKRYQAANYPEGVIGSQINQATALQVLGFYRQARQLLGELETQLQSLPNAELKLKGLLSLGNLLRLQGESTRSQQLLTTSLAIAQTLSTLNPATRSQIHLSLANTLRTLNQPQTALDHYRQAASFAPSVPLRLQAQLNQLSLLINQTKLVSARELAGEIASQLLQISINPPSANPPSANSPSANRDSINAQINFAQSLIRLSQVSKHSAQQASEKDLPDIANLLNQVIDQAKGLQDRRSQSYAQGILGGWYEAQQNWDQAIATTQTALALAETLKASDLSYQWHWQLGRLFNQFGERAEAWAKDQAIDQYSAALSDLTLLRSDLTALNPEVQFDFRARVEPVYRQFVDLLLRDRQPTSEQLSQARNVIEALQLAELDNFFRDACASAEVVNIDNLDPYAAILYPILLGDRIELILKLPGQTALRHASQAGLSAQQINQTAQRFATLLKRRSSNVQELKALSQKLYTWLLQPFEAELEMAVKREDSRIKTLSFVLDGALRNVPMGALFDGDRYLIERYAIAIAPGLNLLEPKPLPRQALNLLIAGAEDAPSFQMANLAPLNYVKLELDGIRQRLKNSQVLENDAFLKTNLHQQINQRPFNIVHLATHGQFSADPEQTFILDWRDRISIREIDDLLFLNDPVRAVKDPIELLVLSACETATGDDRAALGLAGIAIRAGARSTLASLWNIDDASTAEFMVRFYQELAKPELSKAEALRNSQLAFLQEYKGTDYRRPYHWAPFILLGNWL